MKPLETPGKLRPSIEQYLRRFVVRRRRLALVRALALSVLLLALWLLTFSVVDRFYSLPSVARSILLVSLAGIIGVMIRLPLAAMFRRSIDWRTAAEQLEDSDPRFNEMLSTVVSQSLASHTPETSEQLIDRLIAATESRISVRDSRRSVPLAPAAAASVAAAVGVMLLALLCAWPWLGLPRLLARQLLPLADVPPVTTTRLEVTPGTIEVAQGRPLLISARAAPLLGGTVLLRTSTDGKTWTSTGMTPSPEGVFTYQMPALVRDFQYKILAGDAAAGPFSVRVLRRPLVKEFQIRLIYPPHVHRPPLLLTSVDGAIEAPAGTTAEVTIIASEPLKLASVLVGTDRLETSATDRPDARIVRIPVASDQRWTLEMLSEKSVSGVGPPDMMIRALPDHPPTARLLLPEGASLLRPRDQIRIPFQAADDYGLESLEAKLGVDGAQQLSISVTPGFDPRRIDDLLSIDLAQCNVVIGQRVSITLFAKDGAGQTSASPPAYILICPKGVDPYERRRVDDSKEMAQVAARTLADLSSAESILSDRSKVIARIGQASESASLLVRAVLRTAAGLDQPRLATAIAYVGDLSQMLSSRLEAVNSQAAVASAESLREQLIAVKTLATELSTATATLRAGLAADMVLVQLENLAALETRSDPVLTQLRREIESTLADLELSPGQRDLDSRLKTLSAEAAALSASLNSIDFVSAISRWAQSAQPQNELLGERLLTAAQIEAVRRDADLVWARDLQLTSRAVRTIDSLLPPSGQTGASPDLRAALVEAFSQMVSQHEWEDRATQRLSAATNPSTAPSLVFERATQARDRMRNWAGEAELAASTTAPANADEQASAMEANALSSQRQFESARAIDARLYRNSPQVGRRVESEFNRVRQIDDLSQRQQRLEASATTLAAGEAASRQRAISSQIQTVVNAGNRPSGSTDSRQQGLVAIGRMHEEMSRLPLRMGRVEQLVGLAVDAKRRIPTTLPEAAVVSADVASIARIRFEASLQALDQSWQRDEISRVVERMAELRAFAPETSEVLGYCESMLMPPLTRLHESIAGRDLDAAARSIQEIRRGIASVQIGLDVARHALLDRDPLVAAQWFAREAAASLDASTTQPVVPIEAQSQAADALRRAWDDSVHSLAEARLGASASLASILRNYELGPAAASPGGIEWSRQRQWREAAGTPATGVVDPPGFEDSLRAYFKALSASRPQEKP